jgi:anti-sigma regulatory factor (Ser/Thr protein kinase)
MPSDGTPTTRREGPVMDDGGGVARFAHAGDGAERSSMPEQKRVRRSPDADDFGVLGFHEYLPTAEEIVSARHFVEETLGAAGVHDDVIAAAELVVDEFALNAVRHAGTFFSVSVEEAAGAVRIAVRDDSNVFPEVREHVVLSISGRGLSIVGSTAEEWGAQSLGLGKEVWAVLR